MKNVTENKTKNPKISIDDLKWKFDKAIKIAELNYENARHALNVARLNRSNFIYGDLVAEKEASNE